MVPAPLGFGTVALEDGPCLGFLAEAAGVPGARDITAYGGWRAWLAAQETKHEQTRDELDAELDAYRRVAVSASTIAPEWRDAVREHLAITLRLAGAWWSFRLPDEAEPAPVFMA